MKRGVRRATILLWCTAVWLAGTAPATAAPGAAPNAAPNERPNANPARVPAPAPATRPAVAAAAPAATAPSAIGQRAIRRDAAAAAAAAAAAQPGPTTNPATASPAVPAPPSLELRRLGAALAIVLGLIFGLRWVLRRAFPAAATAGASRAVQVLSRTVLSPRQQLMLVRVGRRLIVVGDSGGQMAALSEITDPDEVAALLGQIKDEKLSAAGPAFGTLFGRARHGADAADAPHAERPGDDENPDAIGADRRHPGDADDAEVVSTRRELDGLLAKVRLISNQFNGRK